MIEIKPSHIAYMIENGHGLPADVVLRDTVRLRDLNARPIFAEGRGDRLRFIWRGPGNVPVFSLENCRDLTFEHLDVRCESPCEAGFAVERTESGAGTVTSTNHAWRDVRIYGSHLAGPAFWYRGIDENNEHGQWDRVSISDCASGWTFDGQQSKEHMLTHCRAELCPVGIVAASSFLMLGGAIAVAALGIKLTRVGDPVTVIGTGFEACERLLETHGRSTDAQPIELLNVRYAADQLHEDGNAIVLRHAGPLNIRGGSYGDGDQPIAHVLCDGSGDQVVNVSGAALKSHGADAEPFVRKPDGPGVRIALWRTGCTYRRAAGAGEHSAVFGVTV